VRETAAKRKTDVCNPSEKLRGAPIENLPVVWNIRASGNEEWPSVGDSYSPSSGYGGISCFKRPAARSAHHKGMPPLGRRAPADRRPDMRLRLQGRVRRRRLDPKIDDAHFRPSLRCRVKNRGSWSSDR
jgi:hypothetical protein